MPTNHFFSKGTINEQYLYEDLIIESIQIYGFDVYYLPRTLVDKDQLFGEDPLSKFNDSYMIEMYFDTVEGFQGEKEIITRFGLEIRDETIFTVARRTWLNLVSMDANLVTSIRPNEGDWIYMPTVQRMFEISFVDKDDPFYQVDNLPVYKLYARTVEYSDERLDTGIDVIDAIETKYTGDELLYQILGEQGPTTIYNCKFLLERGTDLYADGLIELENATNSPPAAGQLLIGQDEVGFDAILLEDSGFGNEYFIIQEDYKLAASAGADNSWIEDAITGTGSGFDASDAVLDFTERNPFGEPD
jgi:hypothetical protein